MAKVKLNKMQRQFQSAKFWIETIAVNQPDGTIAALNALGVSTPIDATDAQIAANIEIAKAQGDGDALYARMQALPIEWNDLNGTFKLSVGGYVASMKPNQPQYLTTDGGNEEGGMDLETWGAVIGIITGAIGGISGVVNKDKPSNQPAPQLQEDEEEKTWQNYIGVAIIGLGLLALTVAIVFSGRSKGSE